MRAMRLHAGGHFRSHDEPVPVPGPGDQLVRVTAVGICGSDLHWFDAGGLEPTRLTTPLVLGHEIAGVTADGRRVAIDPAIPCGACELCTRGHHNLCEAVRFAGHDVDGGLREWMAWPERCLFPLPDGISDEAGAVLEPLGVAIHAVDLAHVRAGAIAGVFGCGPIGWLIVRVLALSGAARIVATELASRPSRLEAARAIGAEVFAADGSEARAIREATGGRGLDVAIEAAGDNAAVDASVDAVRPGARIVLVGIPGEERTSFVAASARRKGLTFALARRMNHVYPRAVRLVERGLIDIDACVTHRFPLAETAAAFETASRREGLKVVVHP
jgi:L-iditol 2-dehydrogenase